MEIIYKYYEPDNNYEQIQAELYNNAIGKYGTPGNATANQIKERYSVEGFDNKGVQYAFDGDKPIAYIHGLGLPNWLRWSIVVAYFVFMIFIYIPLPFGFGRD
ncbi:MAG: hypothetical protein ACXABG_11725, partial [Promethearchaeota archaeon]